MATINIGKTSYNWPESGEKDWGDDAIRAVQALATEISRNKNSSAQKGQNNVFTESNRFHKIPTVGSRENDISDVATVNDLRIASSALEADINLELTIIKNFLGTGSTPTTSDLFQISGFSDFFKTLGGISNSASNATLVNILNAIMGYLRSLVPIGKIEAGYHNSNQRFPLLQWEAAGTSGVPVDENSVWLHNPPYRADWLVATGNNSGWYRPVFSTGIWSVCDGITPLPINPFGQDTNWGSEAGTLGYGKRKPFFIPDLTSAFLQGATAGTQTTHGDNTMTLTVAQLPQHKHDLSNYRVVGNIMGGDHSHRIDLTTSFTGAGGGGQTGGNSGSGAFNNYARPGSHTHDVTGNTDSTSHTHTMSRSNNSPEIKELLESDDPTHANEDLANTGSGESVNVADGLKRLPVVYYMKIAE